VRCGFRHILVDVVNMNLLDDADDDFGGLGPAMLALRSDRQRQFVRELVAQPKSNYSQAAERAGYGGESTGKNRQNVLKQIGHRLAHDAKIMAALHEEMGKRLKLSGLIGVAGLIAMVNNPKHRDHFKACEALADRAGFSVKNEIKVNVETTDRTGRALEERIRHLAEQLGIDAAQLLGANAVPALPKVIEGEVVEVSSDG
jgi:phage terminase small subunit